MGGGRRKVRTHKTRGGALLAVLWMSASLAAIALSLASTVRSETGRAETNSDGLRAWYLATGSVERGIQWMMWGPDYRNPDGSPRFWEPNTPRMFVTYPSGEAVIEMIPEMSKLNINSASPNDLLRLVTVLAGNPAQAARVVEGILEWRGSGSRDQPVLVPAQTFQPRRASFEEIEELLLVPGVTPELFYGNYVPDTEGRLYAQGGLRDCLSVWGSNGPFDVNTASPALLEAFGVPRPAIRSILERRAVRPFRNMGDVREFGVPGGRFGLGGNLVWTLRATARLRRPDGSPSEAVRTASAVVKLLDRREYFQNPVHVLRYYDDAWSQFALTPPAVPVAALPRPGAVVR
jgi:general secretion pathway protein K